MRIFFLSGNLGRTERDKDCNYLYHGNSNCLGIHRVSKH